MNKLSNYKLIWPSTILTVKESTMKNLVLFLALVIVCIGGAYGACNPGRVCPSVFDPICAKRVNKGKSEFRTFSNMCKFNNCPEGFKFVKKGRC